MLLKGWAVDKYVIKENDHTNAQQWLEGGIHSALKCIRTSEHPSAQMTSLYTQNAPSEFEMPSYIPLLEQGGSG